MTAGAGDGPHAPFLPTAAGGPSSFHMTAAVTGAAQRLAAGRAHPWTAARGRVLLGAPAAGRAEHAYEIRYGLDFLDGAEDRERADAALEALRPLVPPDRGLPVAGGTEDEALPLDRAHAAARTGRSARCSTRRRSTARSTRSRAGQRDDGGWDFDWLHWDPAVACETRGRVTVDAIALLRANGR